MGLRIAGEVEAGSYPVASVDVGRLTECSRGLLSQVQYFAQKVNLRFERGGIGFELVAIEHEVYLFHCGIDIGALNSR